MKDTPIWLRASEKHINYIERIKQTYRCENRSQAIRTILEMAEENNIGLSLD